MSSLPLSTLRPGVVVPAGAPVVVDGRPGVLVEPYTGGAGAATVAASGAVMAVHVSLVALSLTPPEPPGSRVDGRVVLAEMILRAEGETVDGGGQWWTSREGRNRTSLFLRGGLALRSYYDEDEDPDVALLAVARRVLGVTGG